MFTLLFAITAVFAEDCFKCEKDGLYCVKDGKHDEEYYECSKTFKGYRPCAPGTKCTASERVDYGYNPCTTGEESHSKTEESKSKDKSKEPTTPSVDKSEDNICKGKNGYYCVKGEEHKYLWCTDTYKGYMNCPKGTHCGYDGKAPDNQSPCVLNEESNKKSEEKSTSKSSEKSKEHSQSKSREPETPSVESPSEDDICKGKEGFYCLEGNKYIHKYLWCTDTFKGIMDCPKGTKCGYDGKAPDNQSPCVLDENSIQKSTEKSKEPETPSVESPSEDDICKGKNGLYCVDDGKHIHEFLVCTKDYKGYMECPKNTQCGYDGKIPCDESPCIYPPHSTESTSKSIVTPSVDKSEDDICKDKDGYYCVKGEEHKYLWCTDTYKGYMNCSKGTHCGYDGKVPDNESPCVLDTESYSKEKSKSSDICEKDGYMCIMDGTHDKYYYVCSNSYEGFLPCPKGERCNGKKYMNFSENPCEVYDTNCDSTSENSGSCEEKSSNEKSESVVTPSVEKSKEESSTEKSQSKEHSESKSKEHSESKSKEESSTEKSQSKEHSESKSKEESSTEKSQSKEHSESKSKEHSESKSKEESSTEKSQSKEHSESKSKEHSESKSKEHSESKSKEESSTEKSQSKEHSESKSKEHSESKSKEESSTEKSQSKEHSESKSKEHSESKSKEESSTEKSQSKEHSESKSKEHSEANQKKSHQLKRVNQKNTLKANQKKSHQLKRVNQKNTLKANQKKSHQLKRVNQKNTLKANQKNTLKANQRNTLKANQKKSHQLKRVNQKNTLKANQRNTLKANQKKSHQLKRVNQKNTLKANQKKSHQLKRVNQKNTLKANQKNTLKANQKKSHQLKRVNQKNTLKANQKKSHQLKRVNQKNTLKANQRNTLKANQKKSHQLKRVNQKNTLKANQKKSHQLKRVNQKNTLKANQKNTLKANQRNIRILMNVIVTHIAHTTINVKKVNTIVSLMVSIMLNMSNATMAIVSTSIVLLSCSVRARKKMVMTIYLATGFVKPIGLENTNFNN
ncbi:Cyst wall-specific glycoprotein Jacob family protein [Entamoeba invadens IP1]|uniref:Cyst wall-specific glycoprotein Jacob family protein n=1 Tax=Entamoeba invadens IP1 TaxID=370355 RepID=UPI0002C3D256|nr:Cyst wall-specific glycoprotein Jacob family protein [Entamoeba invadens IP1]ELP90652.1 Cyst wall-specific glycoprotein Jacob family protein [Entamoeba invadens IP1]|eukprot:XP_004257423.1 Cyst wall-specific glycoprotein Jacob family protein [Entamoeba invadens IP1]